MTEPVGVRAPQTPQAPTTAATAVETPPRAAPPSSQEVRDTAYADVDRIRPRAETRANGQRAAQRIATAYKRGGLQAVQRETARNPQLLRAVGNMTRTELDEALKAAGVGMLGRGSLRVEIEEQVESRLIDHVRNQAHSRVDQQLGTLRRARARLMTKLPRMNDADRARAEALIETLDHGIRGYRDLKARMHGNAWEVSDFPVSTDRAMRDLGFSRLGIAGAVARREDHSVENAHHTEMLVDGGLAAIEASHAWHVFGAASGTAIASVAALGILAGLVIHDQAEKVRQRDIAIGRELGL